LNYIKLDGKYRVHGERRGLGVMATMDIVKYAGGSPANFLMGGGANAEQISNAFRILLSDASARVRLIFNIWRDSAL